MLRFGQFELDSDSAELLRHGERIALSPRPFKVLALLVQKDGDEALPALREVEARMPTRRRHVAVAARALIEGRTAESVNEMKAMLSPDFRDPEGRFYVARHVARHGDADDALEQLEGVVADGFSCYPALERDPWLDPLRPKPRFAELQERCASRHAASLRAFEELNGQAVLT